MKLVNETLTKIKGEGNADKVLTGKGSFSKQGFGELVNAFANDTTAKTGDVNISELLRADLKKTVELAKYPQKSESNVLDTCEIKTDNLSKVIPLLVAEQLKCGKKFDLPSTDTMQGSLFLAPVAAGSKTKQIRDMKTGEPLGTVDITNKEYVKVQAKSPAPKNLVTKVRKDVNGKVIN